MIDDKKAILIAGGSGLVGKSLSHSLVKKGHEVRLLSRNPNKTQSPIATYKWDLDEGFIDPLALKNVGVIINLAGASIADRAWTNARKKVLISSRVDGNYLLHKAIREHGFSIHQFIGASAIGFYGSTGNQLLNEASPKGAGFMSALCAKWEESQWSFREMVSQVAVVRIGLVLSRKGGILPTLKKTIVAGVGTVLGSGTQYMSWIHIDDLVQIFHTLIDNPQLNGVVNGVAPNPITQRDFMHQLVGKEKGLQWLIPVPAFLIRIVMGERSHLVLDSTRVVPQFMRSQQFEFRFQSLTEALNDLVAT